MNHNQFPASNPEILNEDQRRFVDAVKSMVKPVQEGDEGYKDYRTGRIEAYGKYKVPAGILPLLMVDTIVAKVHVEYEDSNKQGDPEYVDYILILDDSSWPEKEEDGTDRSPIAEMTVTDAGNGGRQEAVGGEVSYFGLGPAYDHDGRYGPDSIAGMPSSFLSQSAEMIRALIDSQPEQ